MFQFEEVLQQYSPMITSVLKKAKIYKNHDYYRHIATIALWEALKKYNSSKGSFASFAYRYMLTSIYTEMTVENRQNNRFICYEKEKIDAITHYKNKKNYDNQVFEMLDSIFAYLEEDESKLLYDLYIKGETYKDLSKKKGVSIEALKKRRNRIMQKIRKNFSHTNCDRL